MPSCSRSTSRPAAAGLLNETEQARLAEALRLAEQLGAGVRVPGRSVVEEVGAARARNATRVVVGKSRRSRWFELRHGSVVDKLVRSGSGLAVEVAPSSDKASAVRTNRLAVRCAADHWSLLRGRADDRRRDLPRAWRSTTIFGTANISLIFVVPVMVAAAQARARSVALGVRAFRPLLQLLLPAAALPIHHRRSGEPAGPFFLMFVAIAASALRTRTRAQTERAPGAKSHHRRALRLQPQDRRRDRPR